MTRILGSVWAFVVALAIVVALTFALAPTSSATTQRIAHLETLVKCPACDDLSVAQSNAPSAIAVRNLIASDVRHGLSDTTILTNLEDTYGSTILLSPRGSALDDVLWAVPVAILIAGFILYGRLARRRT